MGWQWILVLFRRDLLVSIKMVPSSTFTSLEYFFCTWGKFGVFLGTHSGWKQSTLVWICPWKWIQNPGIMSEHSRNWLLVLKWIASKWWKPICHGYCSFFLSVFFFFFFFFFFFRHWWFTGQQGKRRGHFYFSLSHSTVHGHSDLYLQLCMWDNCHIFSVALLLSTKLLLNEIYHLIDSPFDWLVMECYFLFVELF